MNVLMAYRLQAFNTEILPQLNRFKDDKITFIVKNNYIKNLLPILIKRYKLDVEINILTVEELLEGKIDNMQFDYIVQNPPYATKVGKTKTEKIWSRIIVKTYSLLKVGGEMTSVHPSSWRFVSDTSRGDVSEVANIYKTNNIIYMELNDKIKGFQKFGASTDYDIITLIKEPVVSKTKIVTKSDNCVEVDLSKLPIIPTDNFEMFNKLLAKNGEEKVKILCDGSYHTSNGFGTPAQNASKTKDDTYKYPVVYTATSKNGIVFWYAKSNTRGHFGIPKLILKKGALISILDLDGEYGMTQFAAGIVDAPENLIRMQKALYNPKFRCLKNEFLGIGNDAREALTDGLGHMFKFLKEFRKDFWKEFYTPEMEQELINEGKLDEEGKYIG